MMQLRRARLERKRLRAAGKAAPDGGGVDFWDDVRALLSGAKKARRAASDWRRPAWPPWPGWPSKPGKPSGRPEPKGTAANAGEHKISWGDLDDRLARLRGGDPERAGYVLAGVAANLFRARGEPPELASARDSPKGRPDGWPDGAHMLVGAKRSRAAVACISEPGGRRVDEWKVAEFRAECERAGVKKAIIITDSTFADGCRYETSRNGVKVELWDWIKTKKELETHLLGLGNRRRVGFLA